MIKPLRKDLNRAAPQMFQFIASISEKVELSSDDKIWIQSFLDNLTNPGNAPVVPISKSLQQCLWDTFHLFYTENFGTEYVYSKQDAFHFATIKKFIEKKAEESKIPHSESGKLCAGFGKMLEVASADKFIGNNFRPAIIAQNINNIYVAAKSKQNISPAVSLADQAAQMYAE